MSQKRIVKFEIYRYDPDKDERPYMQKLEVELQPTDKMLLDAIVRIKNDVDDSISIRRSCREGVCGSDAMNINGKNGLACTTNLNELEPIVLRPLPGLPSSRPDRGHDHFFNQYHSIKPFLINDQPPPERERLQSPRRSTSMVCTSAFCALAVPLLARRSGGTPTNSWGRRSASKLPLHRRHPRRSNGERLDNLEDPHSLFRCHTIMNCADVCPKGSTLRPPSERSRNCWCAAPSKR